MKRFSMIVMMSVLTVSLQAYDKKLEKYINALVEKKLKQYNSLKRENAQQKLKIARLQERLEELENTVDEVETKSLVDKVNIGVGFETSVNSFDKTYADGHKHKTNKLWTTKLSLSLKSKITDNMKFSGRLSMYKYWADSTIHPYSTYDSMQGRVPGSSAMFVERAYVDWKFAGDDAYMPSVLTIGRQPSSDGPSHQFKENTTRKATYSALVFDGASDGIVLTSSLKNVLPISGARVRFAYGKGYQNDQTKVGIPNAYIGSDNSLKDSKVYGAFFESNLCGKSGTLFQFGFANVTDIIANSRERVPSKNRSLGDFSFLGMMFEGTNIHNSGWDLFGHLAYSKAKPSKSIYRFGGKDYSLLGNGVDFSDKTSTAYWLGGRYSFDNGYKIGLEYNHGGRYWINATQGSYDLLNKLSARGDVYEGYLIKSINRYSFVRFGGIYANYDYTGSGIFVNRPVKFSELPLAEAKNQVKRVKNLYVKFGLRY